MSRFVFLLSLLIVMSAAGAHAQGSPLKGVVWDPPEDVLDAEADLRRMHDTGVQAVRAPVILNDTLLAVADELGLRLFQELPLDDVPASALPDTLAYARRVLSLALDQASRHASARHFGLARHADTSDSSACAVLQQLTRSVREAGLGASTYYTSPFLEADRCADAVDFVLLDAVDASEPARVLERWRQAKQAPAGVGAVGTWVSPRAGSGLQQPHSPEAQARFLEDSLGTLLEDTAAVAVFVYRWRDRERTAPSASHDLLRPYEHGYGLLTADDVARPAFEVVEGFYTRSQTVFAYPLGAAPEPVIPWAVLIGWLVIVLVAVSYGVSPRFRLMVPRYFRAHGFFREGVREGRDVLLSTSVVVLVSVSLSVGVIGAILCAQLREAPSFALLFTTLPETLRVIVVGLLAQPWILVLLLASFYALGVALWSTLLSVASRKRHPLAPGQALMLVLWPRWPFLALMLLAMAVPAMSAPLVTWAMLVLGGGAVLVSLYAILRTLVDYAAITYVPSYVTLAMGLVNPLVLFLLVGALLVWDLGPTAGYAWHLATRT